MNDDKYVVDTLIFVCLEFKFNERYNYMDSSRVKIYSVLDL